MSVATVFAKRTAAKLLLFDTGFCSVLQIAFALQILVFVLAVFAKHASAISGIVSANFVCLVTFGHVSK